MKLTNKQNLPQAFVNVISLNQHNKDGCYSATTLLKGTREILLTKRHWDEIEIDVSDCVWTVFGTAVHSIMENVKDNTFKEERFEIPVSNSKLTGQIDCYDMEKGLIVDWKTASAWKIIYHNFDDWKKQGLIYAYLLSKNNLPVNHCQFVSFLKDHSKTKARTDSNYPQKPCFAYDFDVTPEDIQNTESFVENKIMEIESNLNTPDDELPVCTSEERWAEPDKWAVMKEGRKSAVRVLNTEEDAKKLVENLGAKHYVEYRPGVSKKCLEYCNCCQFCNYYKNHVKGDK